MSTVWDRLRSAPRSPACANVATRRCHRHGPELGWQTVDPVRETSEGVWRADWVRDGRRLQISALPLTVDDDSGIHTQFSLVLLADAGDIPVGGTQPT